MPVNLRRTWCEGGRFREEPFGEVYLCGQLIKTHDIMYYHIAVTSESCKRTRILYPFYLLDIAENEVEKIYRLVREYNRGEQIRIKGAFIDNRQYPEMIIVRSEETAKAVVNKQAQVFVVGGYLMADRRPLADRFFIEKKDTKDDITAKVFDHVEKETQPKAGLADADAVKNKKVFIVHGHDNELKEATARLVEKIGLEAVILHEQPKGGKTIIGKLEKLADRVGYAIILYTPYDEGREKGSENSKPRARQNVVFEHGLFMGKLGSERVCVLRKGEVEKPSDDQGILYIEVKDGSNEWKHEVAKELKNAGYDVDLNKI